MSWVRIWVHIVFSTKNRVPFLNSRAIRQSVFNHILENAKEKGIWLNAINGYNDHMHCLISLGKEQTVSKVVQLIKGESSFWINKMNLTQSKFTWQDDFWAVGVSESHVEKVKRYIDSQEEHHKKKSFDDEINEFMQKYKWAYIAKDKQNIRG